MDRAIGESRRLTLRVLWCYGCGQEGRCILLTACKWVGAWTAYLDGVGVRAGDVLDGVMVLWLSGYVRHGQLDGASGGPCHIMASNRALRGTVRHFRRSCPMVSPPVLFG